MTQYNSWTGTAGKQTASLGVNEAYGKIGLDMMRERRIASGGVGTVEGPHQSGGTMGANEGARWKANENSGTQVSFTQGRLDKSLLERAESIVDSFDSENVVELVINVEALRGIVLELWKTAKNSSQFHQDILSTLENALLSKHDFTGEDMGLFREAIRDLKNKVLVGEHVETISGRFINQGFSPLAFLSEIGEGDGSK